MPHPGWVWGRRASSSLCPVGGAEILCNGSAGVEIQRWPEHAALPLGVRTPSTISETLGHKGTFRARVSGPHRASDGAPERRPSHIAPIHCLSIPHTSLIHPPSISPSILPVTPICPPLPLTHPIPPSPFHSPCHSPTRCPARGQVLLSEPGRTAT